MSAELPDWLQPGETVCVVHTRWGGGGSIYMRKVERLTKRDLLLDNGDRYRRDWYRVSNSFDGSRIDLVTPRGDSGLGEIRRPDDPTVKRIRAKNAAIRLLSKVRVALEEWSRTTDDLEKSKAAHAALGDWIDHLAADGRIEVQG